jgi:fatty acid desaturase
MSKQRDMISPELLRELSKVDDFRGAFSILFQYIVIAVSACFAISVFSYLGGGLSLDEFIHRTNAFEIAAVIAIYVIAAAIISTRQHALGILVHEATHFRLFRNKQINDLVGDILCAFPIGFSVELYRREHIDHHRHLSSQGDPYWEFFQKEKTWQWPKTKSKAAALFIKDTMGLNFMEWARVIAPWSPWVRLKVPLPDEGFPLSRRIIFLVYYAMVVALVVYLEMVFHFLALWLLPQFTIVNAPLRLRSVAEHIAINAPQPFGPIRHVDPSWIERVVIAPLNINYHLAHHIYPSVPQYRLPQLHRYLLENIEYAACAINRRRYLNGDRSVLAEICGKNIDSSTHP